MTRPELHVLVPVRTADGRSGLEIARAAAAAGATTIQLRDKQCDPAALAATAHALRGDLAPRGVALVINDSLDLALEVGADGLHLGPHDLALADARPRFEGRLGASARTPERARACVAAGADYLGVGPFRATATKPEAGPSLGEQGLRAVAAAVDVPVVAIGGVTPEDVAAVRAAGAHGVAVISAVLDHPDPAEMTRRFRRALDAPSRR